MESNLLESYSQNGVQANSKKQDQMNVINMTYNIENLHVTTFLLKPGIL